MDQLKLAELAGDVPSLRALFVMALPDGLLYDRWTRDDEEWHTDGIINYFSDLMRINRQGLRALQFWPDAPHITVESSESVVTVAESGRFAVGFVFEPRLQFGPAATPREAHPGPHRRGGFPRSRSRLTPRRPG